MLRRITALMLAGVLIAACGGAEEPAATEAPAEEVVEEPTEAPSAEDDAAEAETDGEAIMADDVQPLPGDLNYSNDLVFRLEVDGDVVSDLTIEGVANETGDSSITYDVADTDAANGMATITIYDVEGTTYFETADGTCVSAGTGAPPMSDLVRGMGDILLDPNELVTGQLAPAGTAEVNGVQANQYSLDADNIAQAQGLTNMTEGTLSVAQDGNFVVRLVLMGTGDSEYLAPGTEGDLFYEMNVTPSDSPFAIELPENCIGLGMGMTDGSDAGEAGDEGASAGEEDEPADTEEPSGDTGSGDTGAAADPGVEHTISEVSSNVSYECQGGDVVIEGASNNVTLTGHCNEVIIDSMGNNVDVASADIITVNGAGNNVTYGGDPVINNSGLGNSIRPR